VKQQWGGSEASYSQKGIFYSCPKVVASRMNMEALKQMGLPDLSDDRDHPFTDVALVTDGLAGSAASALPSRLMVSKFVTAFSYGGRGEGEAMDTSGFAGGNILDYHQWWPRVAVAAELGMWLAPESAWEEMSLKDKDSITRSDGGKKFVLYPSAMPISGASARFNFNMMYVKEFAVKNDETLLPRQFYRLPAHKQYSQWPKGLSWSCGNPIQLLGLYKQIQSEDWFALRKTPQFLNKGWSEKCVPAESQRDCCTFVPSTVDERMAFSSSPIGSPLDEDLRALRLRRQHPLADLESRHGSLKVKMPFIFAGLLFLALGAGVWLKP